MFCENKNFTSCCVTIVGVRIVTNHFSVLKGVSPNSCGGIGYGGRGQAQAAVKCEPSDFSHGIRYDDGRELITSFKGPV